MTDVNVLIAEHLNTWTSAIEKKSGAGRGGSGKVSLFGIKKLRELILELAVRGRLVKQNDQDGTAAELLKKVDDIRRDLLKQKLIKKQKTASGFRVEEAPFELPKNWIWTSLGQLAEIGPKNDISDNTATSFVPMPDVHTSHTGEHDQSERLWVEIKKGYTHFADGDVALAKITPCFENSKAAVFTGLCNGVGAGTTELHVARLHSNEVLARFVLLHLKAPSYLENGKALMTGSAGQKRVPRWYFSDTPIGLPPTAEQHRIVVKVDKLMKLCDALEAQAEDSLKAHQTLVETLLETLTNSQSPEDLSQNWTRLETHFDTLFTTDESVGALRDAVLHLAVTGRLTERNSDPVNIDEIFLLVEQERFLSGKAKKPKKPALDVPVLEEFRYRIPNEWALVRFGHLTLHSEAGWSPKCPERQKEGDEWGVLKVSAVTWGTFNADQNKALPESLDPRPDIAVQPGDFLISRANTADLVARSVVVPDMVDRKLMLSDKLIRFRFSEQVNVEYLNLVNLSKPSRDYYSETAGGTSSSMKNVSRAQILNLLVPLPPREEQDRIVEKVQQLIGVCNRLSDAIPQAAAKQCLIADILTTKIH